MEFFMVLWSRCALQLGLECCQISQLGAIVPLEVYPYKYHMQGDFPS